ncbi:MAG: glycogen/starch/alpha-glucan phosphorylase [Alphaproteobacteria bacterium]|nr:glycogen/starch/alpha-glucan phosphorylase [Alphaproteobacteria bacterium]
MNDIPSAEGAKGAEAIKNSLNNHLLHSVGKDTLNATSRDWYQAAAQTVRDRMIERWMDTMRAYYDEDVKRVYYLSMEFLMGRSLSNGMLNMGLTDGCRRAVQDLGYDMAELESWEAEPALGNGGLGRLAACLLDSMATLGIPGFGYGIRYEYGMFTQHIEQGNQVEAPENWLRYGNPWEFPRPGVIYPVRFGGKVIHVKDADGKWRHQWQDSEEVMAMAYDLPVPGYGGKTVNNLRLWSAKSTREFNLRYFNQGNYIEAVKDKTESENLSKVLYPSDSTARGKELRFKQEYFFISSSLQDILARFRKHHEGFDALPDYVAIQLNDTHPAMAVPELMRILVDDYFYDWERAWSITKRVFAYTNHTLLPEALETWPVDIFERLLPRHLQIIYDINQRFLLEVRQIAPGDADLSRRVSLIDEMGERRVRMAHLAFVGSHRVNGVARIHTELMKSTIFSDFHRLDSKKILCVTNGITPRRWLMMANPKLTRLIGSHVGMDWATDLGKLRKVETLIDDPEFCESFRSIKRGNKERLASVIRQRLGVDVDLHSLFDVQVKRIHEYKRQLLNILYTITRYNHIRANPEAPVVSRTIIIGGKSAPGYAMAKLIIKLVNDVAQVINSDPLVGRKLKLVFVPNYNVSTAELIIPAADLSQQISTAGTEASGTGNMKLSLNGALTIGTRDGANIEIAEEVGEENVFFFGLSAHEVIDLRRLGYNPWEIYNEETDLREALDQISSGFFSPDQPDRFRPIFDALTHGGDFYMLLADFAAYREAQEKVDALYLNSDEWTRKAILNVARMGKFSADRTVSEYAEHIWNISPMNVNGRSDAL